MSIVRLRMGIERSRVGPGCEQQGEEESEEQEEAYEHHGGGGAW